VTECEEEVIGEGNVPIRYELVWVLGCVLVCKVTEGGFDVDACLDWLVGTAVSFNVLVIGRLGGGG
jgi:hypothetical protein